LIICEAGRLEDEICRCEAEKNLLCFSLKLSFPVHVKTLAHHESAIAELIASCLDGDKETAWCEFVSRFQPLIASVILRIARRYGRSDRDLVDDLVQETFLRLCKNQGRALRQFLERLETAIFGYLKVVAASVVTDYFRSLNAQKRLGDKLPEPEELIDASTSTSPNAEQATMVREVNECIERLAESGRDKTIFWLYYQQGLTASDISSLPNIGLTTKGVESCIYRLTKAVRNLIVKKTAPHERAARAEMPSTFGEMG
jgi:RNA polymerase sigma-70 factor (ECF subfamily)